MGPFLFLFSVTFIEHFKLETAGLLALFAALAFRAEHPHLNAAAPFFLGFASYGHVKFYKRAGRPSVRGNAELMVRGLAGRIHALGNGGERAGDEFLEVHGRSIHHPLFHLPAMQL